MGSKSFGGYQQWSAITGQKWTWKRWVLFSKLVAPVTEHILHSVFPLISRRKFSQIEVVESHNVLVCISGRKKKLRVYYLSWLRNKILQQDAYYDVCFSLSLQCSSKQHYYCELFLFSITAVVPVMAFFQLVTWSTAYTFVWYKLVK